MSREIKFRGRSLRIGAWVYGCYLASGCDAPAIVFGDGEQEEIDPESLGQLTGLKDKNGVEIYEGDVVLVPSGTLKDVKDIELDGETYRAYLPNPPIPYLVSNLGYAFFLGTKEKPDYAGIINHQHNKMAYDVEVIGNIHENPELLGGDKS